MKKATSTKSSTLKTKPKEDKEIKENVEFQCFVCGKVITDVLDLINFICTPCRMRIVEDLFQKFEKRREQRQPQERELLYAKKTKSKEKAQT